MAFFNLCIIQSPLLSLLPLPGLAYVLFCFIFLLIYLTSSKKIMGKFANHLYQKIILIIVGIIVTCLNLTLLWEIFYK